MVCRSRSMGEERMSKEEDLALLCDIVGSLAIDQFEDQEEYRAVINEIFYQWRKRNV